MHKHICAECKFNVHDGCVDGCCKRGSQLNWKKLHGGLRLIEGVEIRCSIYELFYKCIGSLEDKKGPKHKGSKTLKKKTIFEKMIKDAAVTFFAVRQAAE